MEGSQKTLVVGAFSKDISPLTVIICEEWDPVYLGEGLFCILFSLMVVKTFFKTHKDNFKQS
jgi:hypothetical protein